MLCSRRMSCAAVLLSAPAIAFMLCTVACRSAAPKTGNEAAPTRRADTTPTRSTEAAPAHPAATTPPPLPPRPEGRVIEQSADMLVRPAKLANSSDFVVATHPPKIEFCAMQGLPPLPKDHGLWSSWGQGILASNGMFYVTVGNHLGINGHTYVYEYDPKTAEHHVVVDVFKQLGLHEGDYGHGKLHGRLDELDDGRLIFATYWGEHPPASMPAEKKRTIGGHMLTYDIRTGAFEDLGMPVGGDSWPMHATDLKRKRFFAIGVFGNFVAYDLTARRAIFAGPLPATCQDWDPRDTLVDDATGCVFGSAGQANAMHRYDPEKNSFYTQTCFLPPHPRTHARIRPIRCYTPKRTQDGVFYAMTYDGVMLRFHPDEVRAEVMGLNWEEGYYTASMAMSPGERYLYYTVAVHGEAFEHGSPVVQYDLKTGTKKALAFLHPYFQKKHGYVFGGSYSVCISPDGADLFIFWNGKFRGPNDESQSFGDPSFMVLHIPPEERAE